MDERGLRQVSRLPVVLFVAIVLAPILLFGQSSTPVGKLPIAELQKQADAGDPAAENELGIRYRLGSDVEEDKAKAVEWFRKAAREGYPKAFFNLGAAYYNGDGVAESPMRALVWFLLGKDAGDHSATDAVARAQSEMPAVDFNTAYLGIGDEYVHGDVLKQDYAKAMYWYRKGAAAGSGLACHRIALLYAQGLGVPKDNAEIILWLQGGVDHNDPSSAYDLARAYEQGVAVTQDLAKAEKLYRIAAAYNNANAMFALGVMYRDGKGVTFNPEKALVWFMLAAQYGNPDAAAQVKTISAQVGSKQVEKAKRDAASYVLFWRRPLTLTPRTPTS